MERHEMHGERLHLLLHLEELFLAEVVDAELRRRDVDDLAVIQLHAELVGEDAGELAAAAAVLAADGNHEFVTHTRVPLGRCVLL